MNCCMCHLEHAAIVSLRLYVLSESALTSKLSKFFIDVRGRWGLGVAAGMALLFYLKLKCRCPKGDRIKVLVL